MGANIFLHVSIIAALGCLAAAQSFVLKGGVHTTFPSDIPADTTIINIQHAQLISIPDDAFDDFFQLETLVLAFNPIPKTPNLIPVGGTLKALNMNACGLTVFNATVYNELRVLQNLNLRGNRLTSFPYVPVGPRGSLTFLHLQLNRLVSFPPVAGYKRLYFVIISDNPIAGELTDEDLRFPRF